MARRACVRTTCTNRAETTLTFDYATQTAVLAALTEQPVPGAYDLCRAHAERTSPPRGWEMIRLPEVDEPAAPPVDDLLALADAIREVGLRHDDPEPATDRDLGDSVVVLAERRHLRVIADR